MAAHWVPQGNGRFVRPADACPELLPEGFPFDPGWPWIKAIKFGNETARKSDEQRQRYVVARELGFPDIDTLERARRFAALPTGEQERILVDWDRRAVAELPQCESANSARRADRVAAQAVEAPDRHTEQRTRSVAVSREAVKEEAKQYLCHMYTNVDGEMICQACKAPLPFKLNDGSDYFEAVEFLPELKRRHHENYLALCPNHAAMFQYANGSADRMLELIAGLTGNELAIVLARKDATVYFTTTHRDDLKAVIQAEQEQSRGDGAGGQDP